MPQSSGWEKQQEEISAINEAYRGKTFYIFSHYDDLTLFRKKKLEIRSGFGQEFEKAEMLYIAQQMFPWFCRFRFYSSVFWLMEHAHSSPFVLGKNGYNTLHLLAQQGGHADLLALFLSTQRTYEFWEPQDPRFTFSWQNAVLFPERTDRNNPLHLSVIQKDAAAFVVLC